MLQEQEEVQLQNASGEQKGTNGAKRARRQHTRLMEQPLTIFLSSALSRATQFAFSKQLSTAGCIVIGF